MKLDSILGIIDRFFGIFDRLISGVLLLFFVAASAVTSYFAWQIGGILELSLLNQLAVTLAGAVLAPALIWVIYLLIRIFSYGDLD